MSIPNLSLESSGIARFNADAVIVSMDFDVDGVVSSEHRSAIQIAIDEIKVIPGSGYENQRFLLADMSLDDLKAMMTLSHEREHYRSFISTPLGLFMWRLFQCIAVNSGFICELLRKYDLTSGFSVPLLQFAKSATADLVGDEATRPQIREGNIVPRVVRDGVATREAIEETETYIRCVNVLLNGDSVTVGEFLEILNQTIAYTALRSDFSTFPTIITRLDPLAPLHGEGIYSVRELMEGASRLQEFIWVKDYPHWNADEWRAQNCTGVYGRVFNEVHKQIGVVDIGRSLIDISLMTPIDPCFGAQTFLLEDLHPGHRFSRLLKETSRSPLTKSSLGRDLIKVEIEAGLIPAHRVAGAITGRPLVTTGRFGGTPGRSGLNNETEETYVLTTRFYELMERKFQANLKLRAEHSTFDLIDRSENRPRAALANSELPNFELFNNYCRMNIYSAGESDNWLRFFHCLRAASLSLVRLALVTGVPPTNLSRFVTLALQRAASECGTDVETRRLSLENFRSTFQLEAMVDLFLKPPISDYVKEQFL
jgi:hypothetical protein